MTSRHRVATAALIACALFCLRAPAAELSAVQSFRSVNYFFVDDSITFRVRVAAFETTESQYVRKQWTDSLSWHVVDSAGRTVPLSTTSAYIFEESTAPVGGRNSWDERPAGNYWSSTATVVLSPLPAGTYTISASYLGITSHPQFVQIFRGDESPTVASGKLHRDALRPGISLEEYRRLQLKRFELVPLDESSLWDLALAWANAPQATQHEVDEYFARAIQAGRSRVAATFASADGLPEDVSQVFEMRVQVAAAYHELMPALIASEGKLSIFWDAMEGEVRLSDRESRKDVRSICVPPCCRYPMDPF